jgi:hypothetical protein
MLQQKISRVKVKCTFNFNLETGLSRPVSFCLPFCHIIRVNFLNCWHRIRVNIIIPYFVGYIVFDLYADLFCKL